MECIQENRYARPMLWTLLGILLTASTVQAQAVSDWRRFDLFGSCRPMRLVVEFLSPDAQAVGLTKERIQLAAESRLRAARLYTESWEEGNYAYLYININVVGPAYSISVQYKKQVTDRVNNSNGTATTWDTGITGTHGGNANHIVQHLSGRLDLFLANYLRVNESACDPS